MLPELTDIDTVREAERVAAVTPGSRFAACMARLRDPADTGDRYRLGDGHFGLSGTTPVAEVVKWVPVVRSSCTCHSACEVLTAGVLHPQNAQALS